MMTDDITYGQLEDALLALGFKKHIGAGRGTQFTHPSSDAIILLPVYTREEEARERHLVVTQAVLHEYGYLDRDEFHAFVRNRDRVAS